MGQEDGEEEEGLEPKEGAFPQEEETSSALPPWSTIILLVLLGFTLNMEYSILMPTVWEYVQSMGGSKSFLGLVLASFSLGRIVFFAPIGYMSDVRPMAQVYILTCGLGIVGNFLYGIAGHVQRPNLLLVARVLTGIGACNGVTTRAYLARSTSLKMRTTAIAVQNGIQFLGVVVGPVLNLLFNKLDVKYRFLEINKLTAAGYFLVLPNALSILGFLTIFKEPPHATTRPKPHQGHAERRKWRSWSWSEPKRVFLSQGGWWCIYTALITTFSLSALETAATPIASQHFHWSTMENSYFFSGLALAGVASIIATIILGKKAGQDDRRLMVFGFCFLVVALSVDLITAGDGSHVSETGIIVGGVFLVFGLILVSNPNASLFSKIIGDGHNQGTFSSCLFLAIAMGRFLGPLMAGWSLETGFTDTYYFFFGLLMVLVLIPFIFLPFLWRSFGMALTGGESLGQLINGASSVLGAEDTAGTSLEEPLLLTESYDDEEQGLQQGDEEV